MSSSATNIRSSWSDPFHRSLCLRRKLESRYNEQLCLPQLQRSRDRLMAIHINYSKESVIDAATRLFNDTKAPPSSMTDESLLTSVHDNIYADDFGLDVGIATSMEECGITEGLSDHPGHYSPALSPSEALTLLDSLVVGSSALESSQALGQALSVGNAQPMASVASAGGPLAAPIVVHDAAHISAQHLPTNAAILTPASTPGSADSPSAGSTLPAASKVVIDVAPEAATNATAVSCKLLRG